MTFAAVLACFIIVLWGLSGRHVSINFHSRQTVPAVTSAAEDPNPETRFASRKARMEQVCSAEGLNGLDQFMVESAVRRRPNILYIDEYKMLYCVIPKVR